MTALPAEWVNGWPGSANSSLVNVRLSFNNFSGPFPAGLGAAPALTFLVINNNTFRCACGACQGLTFWVLLFFPEG